MPASNFRDAMRLYIAGMSQDERMKMLQSLDSQRGKVSKAKEKQIDQLQNIFMEIWKDSPAISKD